MRSAAAESCLWVLVSFLLVGAIFVYAFFYQGGRHYISPDGEKYLAMTRNESVPTPFNTRILKPCLAAWGSSVSGVSSQAMFQLLSAVELFGSLGLLAWLVRERGGHWISPGAIVVAYGAALATIFGRMPVLVDLTLFFLTCLFLAAVVKEWFGAAAVCVALSVLTKEYGIILAAVWVVEMLCRRKTAQAFFGAALLPAPLLICKLSIGGEVAGDFLGFLSFALRYIFGSLGNGNGFKIVYYWLWAAMWPLLGLASLSIASNINRQKKILPGHWSFIAVLPFIPLLLTGDWERSLMVIVPFATVVSMAHPLAANRAFWLLLAAGGIATALPRPSLHHPIPSGIGTGLLAISIASSAGLMAMILNEWFRWITKRGMRLNFHQPPGLATESACPLCNEMRAGPSWIGSVSYRGKVFPYVQCQCCGSLYSNPMPDHETLAQMYGAEYQNSFSDIEHESVSNPAIVFRALAPYRSGGIFLDYGCGGGRFLSEAAKREWQVFGVEFDREVAAKTEQTTGVRVFARDQLAENEIPPADVLHLGDVIEHLTDLNATMTDILKLIKPGGILVAQGPLEANPNLFLSIVRLARFLRGRDRIEMAPYHVLLATAEGQKIFFQRFGLEELEFRICEVAWPAPGALSLTNLLWPRAVALYLIRRLSQFISLFRPDRLGNRYSYVGRKIQSVELAGELDGNCANSLRMGAVDENESIPRRAGEKRSKIDRETDQ